MRISWADVVRRSGCLVLLATLAGSVSAADWPGFLGPARNGISGETGLIDTFPATGPARVWRVAGGVGMSGLAVADGRVNIRDGRVLYGAAPGGSETGAFPGICLDPEIQRAVAEDSAAGDA